MKAVTSDLCWVANLLFQLRIAPSLSSSSSQFVLFSFSLAPLSSRTDLSKLFTLSSKIDPSKISSKTSI